MKSSNKVILKRILKQLKPYGFWLALTIFFSLINVVGTLTVPVIFGQIINLLDLTKVTSIDYKEILKLSAIIGGIVGFTALTQWLTNVINNLITYNVVKDIREQAFANLQRLPLKYIDSHSYGDIISRNIADVDTFADGLLMGFTQLFTGVLTIIGTMIIMLVLNWIIALIILVLTPLSLFVAKFIASRTHHLFKSTSEIRGEQTGFIDEMIGNLKVVKAFNHEEENLKKFDEINNRLTKASLKSIFFSSLTNPVTRFINAFVYAVVALSGGLMLVFSVSLPLAFNVGILASLLAYANQYTKPFNEISGVVTELQNAFVCAGRIYALIDEKPQSPDKENAIELSDVNGDVEFENVYFSYEADKKLIENLNIKAKAGQRIAIVGPTGCGKTTLINLLMRFYEPDRGKIKVDGNEICDITRKSLRSNYGMVLQDTWLKNGTVRENIALGKPNATEDEIIAAAKSAHAHNFIMQLPDGYDTQIGEDGGSISQGQKQLLCIARIMLCLPPMLILDEATSSIDTRTEIKIQRAFASLMTGRTSFIVAHRLSTIKNADLILVMNDGKIIEQGTHTQLLELNGFYSKLYNSQFAV